jgi:hypothetical protein
MNILFPVFFCDQDVGGWTILKLIFERHDGVVWTGLVWLRIKTTGDSEDGNEPSGSVKFWEVLE